MHIAYRDGGRYFGEKKNDLNAALSYLQQAYNLNPKDYETVRLLAVSNGMGGKKNEAIKYFEEAVKLRPNEAFAYYNLGNAYYINGDEESGQFNHNKAIQLDPSLQEKINK
jgi:Flp pilus assembly protein TadD